MNKPISASPQDDTPTLQRAIDWLSSDEAKPIPGRGLGEQIIVFLTDFEGSDRD